MTFQQRLAAAGHQRRSDERIRTFHRATLAIGRAPAVEVTVHNISKFGFMAQTRSISRSGTSATLTIGEHGPLAAWVQWSNGEAIGCEFKQPLRTSELMAIWHSSEEDCGERQGSWLRSLQTRIERLAALFRD